MAPTHSGTAAELIRTFIAVELAPDLRAPIDDVRESLRSTGADVKWVESDHYHITLKFLGDVPAHRIPEVADAVQKATAGLSTFRILFRGTGAFPNLRRPNAIWVGVTEGADRLAQLADTVESALEPLGFQREGRPFRAHLTIGRVRSPKGLGPLSTRIAETRDLLIGHMEVTQAVVMKSVLTPKGPIYTKLSAAGLSPQGG